MNKFTNLKNIKFIKNIKYPSCKNCIYYKPSLYDFDFYSTFSRCEKFGKKNLISDNIIYDYADLCRSDKQKCDLEGKYFEKEANIKLKIIKYKIISTSPYLACILLTFMSILLVKT